MELQPWRPWDALPSAALATYIAEPLSRIDFITCHRYGNRGPRPVAADSHYFSNSAVDDALFKYSYPYASSLPDPFDGWRSIDPNYGVRRLEALIGRASGGAAVISLYFFPFLTSISGPPDDDALLRLIAQR